MVTAGVVDGGDNHAMDDGDDAMDDGDDAVDDGDDAVDEDGGENVGGVGGENVGGVGGENVGGVSETHDSNTIDVARESLPMNEFTSNDKLHYLAFPTLFFLGEGFGPKPGGLQSKDLHIHQLKQFTANFATNKQWLFTELSQKQRFNSISAVSMKVKHSTDAFEAFGELANSPAFLEKLVRANENPTSAEAREVIAKFMPLITSYGTHVALHLLNCVE